MQDIAVDFPISKSKSVNGSRRLAREKVLQILMAYEISDTKWQTIFSHIFFRKFNFGDNEEIQNKKLLTEEEIMELDSDIPINWDDEEIKFGRDLVKYTIENKSLVNELIIKFAANWKLERIALIDKLLMHNPAVNTIVHH